ncbi:tetratricopeptide repeat protein [Hahella ganghwensis]|uniref:tetratricopeptide repeat protein n=1 Tax=Hahella ganghwensis TaxID=286420 RepID=UPI000381DD5E|nr:tetratricopeptide repeat protein [Hahella ganghwensis]
MITSPLLTPDRPPGLLLRLSRAHLLILTLTSLWSLSCTAQDSLKHSSINQSLKELTSTAKYEDAYQLGLEHLASGEGDPTFDFYFGLSALESGHYPEAQFAFERLVAQYPDQDRFRLEYARTLFLLEQYAAAREEFQNVLANQPPVAVKTNINRFLDVIEERENENTQQFSGYVDLGGGFDSNINNATNERFIGLFELPDSALESESGYAAFRTNMNYGHSYSQINSANVSFNSRHKHNFINSDYDLDSARLSAFWKHSLTYRELQLGGAYQHILLDAEDYQRSTGIFGQWKEQWSDHILTYVYTGVSIKDSFANELLNAYQPIASLALLAPYDKLIHILSFITGTENPRTEGGTYLVKDFNSVGYKVSYQISSSLIPYLGASAYFADYKDEHPVFGDTREDESYQATTGGEWKISKDYSVLADVSYTKNSSSLDIYDYSRWKGELRFRMKF